MSTSIIIFNSTHQELKTEKHLQENNIEFEVVPLPEEISAGCGLAIEANVSDVPAIKDIIKRNHVTIKAIM